MNKVHHYNELANILINLGMTARFVHKNKQVAAVDPKTFYVYFREDHDEIRLVGKNGIDIVSFVFDAKGNVTVNG